MKITAINSIKYKGKYIAPDQTFDAVKAIATDLLEQGVATPAVVDTSTDDAAAEAEAALIEKIKAVKDPAELAELIPDNETRQAILAAGEARWKELDNADSASA